MTEDSGVVLFLDERAEMNIGLFGLISSVVKDEGFELAMNTCAASGVLATKVNRSVAAVIMGDHFGAQVIDGPAAVSLIFEARPELPILMLSALEEVNGKGMAAGASDNCLKDETEGGKERIRQAIKRIIALAKTE